MRPAHSITESLTYDLGVGADERRGPAVEQTPYEAKARLRRLLDTVHAVGLAPSASYAVDTYLTVADGFESDGLLQQSVDCLGDLASQLAALIAARSGAPTTGLITADADLLPYRDRHNLHVVDDRYLTGAQPTERGYRWLQSKGVSTVISLRLDADTDRRTVQGLGMTFLHIAWADEEPPTVSQVQRVLAAVDDAPGRVFQHCLRGIGRDLTMSGCYQVAAGCPVEQVLAEARTSAPRWETDQQVDPATGEPVQFQLLRSFAAELAPEATAPVQQR